MEEVEAEEVVAAASSSSVSGSSVEAPGPKSAQRRIAGPAKRQSKGCWTEEEDEKLIKQVQYYGGRNWKKIAESFLGRTDVQCLHRWQKVLNPELIKGPWTKEEDDQIIELVAKHGSKKWSIIAKSLPGRIGKQCRERWHNHLNPAIKKDAWTEAEEVALIRAHQIYGNKWAEIARFLPGRADNSIKNHWNCSVKKKLCSYISSGLLGPIPCVAYNYHNALKGKCVAVCKHNGDSSVSCEQRGCFHGDASCLEISPSATWREKQHLSLSPPETSISEFSEGTAKFVKLEKDIDNSNGVISCRCTSMQEDGNLSDDSGGNLILKSNEPVLVADADLGHLPEKLVLKPREEASPSCLQLGHCTLSFSSPQMAEAKIPSENLNRSSGSKKNVDVASFVPSKDANILEGSRPITEKSMDKSCDASDSGAASTSSILHTNDSCDPIRHGNSQDFYSPDQFSNLQFGRLCYSPVNLTYWDVSFSKTLESPNQLEQDPVYSDPHTYFRGSSPESILRNAARNFKNIPSILRKRRRETSRSLPIDAFKTNSSRFGFNGVSEVRGGNYRMSWGSCDNLNVKQLSVCNHDHPQAQKEFSVKSVERRLENELDMEWENVDTKCPCTDTAAHNPMEVNLL
ncbi:hypothetical protein H6P81_016920 [Aristolochia fimbriata]|uniref:Uncharacterized protein n=1 Tax=Aristolochia fimbriata TaxID=158543 RepID=A0AAV7DY00_ARIFI|nr:hypothetical protein H6P81_016920 [Aristolochia fimbriata]